MDLVRAQQRLAQGVPPAELAGEYLVDQARHHQGIRAFQGRWEPPLDTETLPALETFRTTRLWKLDRPATRSLLAWGAQRRNVTLLFRVPSALEVLAAQARGSRFICLVDESQVLPPHANGYLFVAHDLCHLEKFADPEHHDAQVGFFSSVHRALLHPAWLGTERTFDPLWITHRDAVVSDMNGSVIFLVAALKMKLKMAVRRRLARERGREAPVAGPLSDEEEHAYRPVLDEMLRLMDLPVDIAGAAHAVSKKRDTPPEALRLHAHFAELGRAISVTPQPD